MGTIHPKKLLRMLKKLGWYELRQVGSHLILKNNEIISFVSINLQEYRMKYSEKSVKKTLSIPAWLNTLAIKHNVNFSQTLQEALKKELKLDK